VQTRTYETTAALGCKYLTTPITTTARHCGDITSKERSHCPHKMLNCVIDLVRLAPVYDNEVPPLYAICLLRRSASCRFIYLRQLRLVYYNYGCNLLPMAIKL